LRNTVDSCESARRAERPGAPSRKVASPRQRRLTLRTGAPAGD